MVFTGKNNFNVKNAVLCGNADAEIFPTRIFYYIKSISSVISN